MSEKSVEDQVLELIEANFDWKASNTLLGINRVPFDLSRENIHENKREFLLERDTVSAVLNHTNAILETLLGDKKDKAFEDMASRLNEAIDRNAGQSFAGKMPKSALDIARRNILDTGFFNASLFVLIDLVSAYRQRKQELDEQEEMFWSVAHRPPNYYARSIALRFARFYARQRSKKPTFGTSSQGSHPSTEYGRILEAVFEILEISGNIRSHAEWAISQITEDDIAPPRNALMKLAGMATTPVQSSNSLANALAAYSDIQKKG